MRFRVPNIIPEICITDDPYSAASISSCYNKPMTYFPIFAGPRLARPDGTNEVIRRINTIARLQPKSVILMHLPEESIEHFKRDLPEQMLVISDDTEMLCHGRNRTIRNGELRWGRGNLAVGLLTAKSNKQLLRITEGEQNRDISCFLGRKHLIVLEDVDPIASVIAANYAYSVGASILVIPARPEGEKSELYEILYSAYDLDGFAQGEERLRELQDELRKTLPDFDFSPFKFITFITHGTPWGIAFQDKPITHLFAYPDLGVFLANSIERESRVENGLPISLLIDPELLDATDIDKVSELLQTKGSAIRYLRGDEASVERVGLAVEAYPYDFMFISTHAADLDGELHTYVIADDTGTEHEIICEVAPSISRVPGTELFELREFFRPVQVDGIDLRSNEGRANRDLHKIRGTFYQYAESDRIDLRPVHREAIGRVTGAKAIRCSNGNYMPMLHLLASGNRPIVINNSCSSWLDLSKMFVFAGARCYLGPATPVLNAQAERVAEELSKQLRSRPVMISLFRAQRTVFQERTRPYLMVGTHFTTLGRGVKNAAAYRENRLAHEVAGWTAKARSSVDEHVANKSLLFARYLRAELMRDD